MGLAIIKLLTEKTNGGFSHSHVSKLINSDECIIKKINMMDFYFLQQLSWASGLYLKLMANHAARPRRKKNR